jgi:DeoR family glycerol-3-phosphate regulon repressor
MTTALIAGGLVRKSDGGIVGEATVDFIKQFKVDYAVIGASAIDLDGTTLDYDYREVRVAREIVQHARQTILVADAMKFERNAPVRIAHLSAIDVLVTDTAPLPRGRGPGRDRRGGHCAGVLKHGGLHLR